MRRFPGPRKLNRWNCFRLCVYWFAYYYLFPAPNVFNAKLFYDGVRHTHSYIGPLRFHHPRWFGGHFFLESRKTDRSISCGVMQKLFAYSLCFSCRLSSGTLQQSNKKSEPRWIMQSGEKKSTKTVCIRSWKCAIKNANKRIITRGPSKSKRINHRLKNCFSNETQVVWLLQLGLEQSRSKIEEERSFNLTRTYSHSACTHSSTIIIPFKLMLNYICFRDVFGTNITIWMRDEHSHTDTIHSLFVYILIFVFVPSSMFFILVSALYLSATFRYE